MKKALVFLLAVATTVSFAFAQTPPEPDALDIGGEGLGDIGSDVAAELARERERQKREKEGLLIEKEEIMEAIARLRSDDNALNRKIPAAQDAYNDAMEKEKAAYATLSKRAATRDEIVARERSKFIARTLAKHRGQTQAAYARQKAAHDRDKAFIEANRVRVEDFDGLVLLMDKDDPAKVLRFDRSTGSVSGQFPTMDFDVGQPQWHILPDTATFQVAPRADNAFLAEAMITLGMDLLGQGGTNAADWRVALFVAKDFETKTGGGSRFGCVAIRWAENRCWQVGVVPVFDPTEMPARIAITEETPFIAEAIADWKLPDPGVNRMVADAERAIKIVINEVKIKRQYVRKVEQEVERQKARIGEQITQKEQDLVKIEQRLQEYEDEDEPADDGLESLDSL